MFSSVHFRGGSPLFLAQRWLRVRGLATPRWRATKIWIFVGEIDISTKVYETTSVSNFGNLLSLVLCFNSLWSKFNICAVAGRVIRQSWRVNWPCIDSIKKGPKSDQIRSVMLKATFNAWLVFGVGMMDREHTHVLYIFWSWPEWANFLFLFQHIPLEQTAYWNKAISS